MRKKRGKFFVLIYLLLLFILTIQIVSAVEAPKYQNLIAKGDDDNGNDHDNYDAHFENNLGSYARIGCDDGPGWPATFYEGDAIFLELKKTLVVLGKVPMMMHTAIQFFLMEQ